MSPATSPSFMSSFPIWIPCISFTPLIAVARTCNTMLKSSGESRHPCLVPDLSGSSFSFEKDVSSGFVIYDLYCVEVGSLCAHFLKVVLFFSIRNGCCVLSQAFSASIERVIRFLFFSLLMRCITLIDLWILKNPCIPGINPT